MAGQQREARLRAGCPGHPRFAGRWTWCWKPRRRHKPGMTNACVCTSVDLRKSRSSY